MKIRWILGVLLGLFVFCFSGLAFAQDLDSSAILQNKLQKGDQLSAQAFAAFSQGKFEQAEEYWTQVIDIFPRNPAVWSNRGNVRAAQNHLEAAIADFNQAIYLDPKQPDSYLNRGVVYEQLGQWNKAIVDYETVLAFNPNDAMAYNNLGNVKASQGQWQAALGDYQKAMELAPDFAFARANYALILYQVGDTQAAIEIMRTLVRKYSMFPDMRAALSAALWINGQVGEAESNWVAAMGLDSRYQDLDWVENVRRWPPAMVQALEKFLKLQ